MNDLRSRELKALNDMNNLRLLMYEQLRVWAQGFKCYEHIRVVDDMNNCRSWVEGSKWYEQLRVVDDMNNLRSYKLKALDIMNNLGL